MRKNQKHFGKRAKNVGLKNDAKVTLKKIRTKNLLLKVIFV